MSIKPQKTKLLFRHRSMEMGGIENVLLTILNELDKSEYEITLLLTYRQGEFLHRIPKEVKVLSIGEGIEAFSKNKSLKYSQKAIRRLKYWRFQKNPNPFYKKYQLFDAEYEIAFSHYMFNDVLNSPNKSSKKIFWIHGDLRNSGFSFKRNAHFVQQMKRFDKGVFVSRFSKDIVEKAWKTELPNTEVIYNPLPIADILNKAEQPSTDDFGTIDFLAIGRLFWQKGFKDLVLAHNRLIKEGFKIHTLILGEGTQREELESLIRDFHLEDFVILGGYHANPYPYLKQAKYFILPSYSEGYPLVVAEALLLNTYVLSTNVGGIPEIVTSEKQGILFKPGEEQLYQTMKKVLDLQIKTTGNSEAEIIKQNLKTFHQINDLFHS